MRIIPKLQKGGDFSSFFTQYTATNGQAVAQQKQASAEPKISSKQEKTDDIEIKDILDIMKGLKALPNEAASITNDVRRLLQLKSAGVLDEDDMALQLATIQYKLIQAPQNYDRFYKAYDDAVKENSLDEIAIASNGKLFVQVIDKTDKNYGKIDTVSTQTLYDNLGKYAPLSNSQLMSLRKNAGSEAFSTDSQIFNITHNGISYDTVTKALKDSIIALGYDSSSSKAAQQILEAYQTSQDLSQEELQTILEASNRGFQVPTSMKSNFEQIQNLKNYLMTTLSPRIATWARLKFAPDSQINGKPLTERQALSLLVDSFISQKSISAETFGGKGRSGSSQNDSAMDDYNENLYTAIQRGRGGSSVQTHLGRQASTFPVRGLRYNIPNLEAGHTYSVEGMLDKSKLEQITDGDIYFGNKQLGYQDQKKIMLNSNNMVRIILPCVRTDNGIKPNFNLIDKYLEVTNNILANNPNISYDEWKKKTIEQLKNDPDLNILVQDGKFNTSLMGTFLVTQGVTSTSVLDFSSDELDTMEKQESDLFGYSTKNEELQKIFASFYNNSIGQVLDEADVDDTVSSTIFIPLSNDTTGGTFITQEEIEYRELKDRSKEAQQWGAGRGLDPKQTGIGELNKPKNK